MYTAAFLALALATCAAHAAIAPDPPPLPAPRDLGNPATLGLGIQRTMALLATSTPSHRNTVRILFYGQSITEQPWWKMAADDLRRRFPYANLVIENRALGGFASQLLYRTAPTDVYPFYPDLMIFHVYGDHTKYEQLIAGVRANTTAEVLIQTDHVTNDADLNEETDASRLYPNGKIWNSFMNYLWLPTLARKYGTGIEYQRDLWKEYLRQTGIHARQLLQDDVHPNLQGDWLMAQFADAYLAKRPDAHVDPMQCDTVRTFSAGRDLRWSGHRMTLPFDGNRVDVVFKRGSRGEARVRIDGRPPSDIPELYAFTRALAEPGGKWPAVLRMACAKPLLVEQWTMQVTKDSSDPKVFHFRLAGSRTGPDGEGRSDRRFVSNSGRVLIDPADWNVDYSLALGGIKPVPDSFEVHWSVEPMFRDAITPDGDLQPGIDDAQMAAQGLTPGHHELQIDGDNPSAIAAIRIYRPPYAEPTAAAVR